MNIPEGLPQHAKQVFKGVLFEVWQWEQVLYDGSTKIFERAVRSDSVAIIPVYGDAIVVEIQEQPQMGTFYSLPGGRCDDGEKPMSAARRELLEETGYTSSDWNLISKSSPPSHHVAFSFYLFVARRCEKKSEMILDAGEKVCLKFFSFDEFLMLSDEPTFRHECVKELLLRARYDEKKRSELHNLLFQNS